MKFALLGFDPQAEALLRFVAQSSDHEFVWACDVGDAAATVRQRAPAIVLADEWESLLLKTVADVVYVSSSKDHELRAEQMRKLVQEGSRLIVSHPAVPSILVYFELESMQQETGATLIPFLPARHHPFVGQMASMIRGDDPSIGAIEQVTMERPLADRSQLEVSNCFCHDSDLLRSLCGEFDRIGAMGSTRDSMAYSNLNAQLVTTAGLAVRWSVEPAHGESPGRIKLHGTRGTAVLSIPIDYLESSTWTLTIDGDEQSTRPDSPIWNPAQSLVDQMVKDGDPSPNWADALRTMQMVEALERSVAKGRTVPIAIDDYDEEGTFKGVMTATGCGVLCLGLGLVVLVAVVEFMGKMLQLKVAAWMRPGWQFLLLVVLVVFLAMQLFGLVFKTDNDTRPKS